MALLRVSPSGQVYDTELAQLKITRDQDGGYYVHGRGHWIRCQDLAAAEKKRQELGVYDAYGGRR